MKIMSIGDKFIQSLKGRVLKHKFAILGNVPHKTIFLIGLHNLHIPKRIFRHLTLDLGFDQNKNISEVDQHLYINELMQVKENVSLSKLM
jgi:hypothetical protein